MKPNIDQVLSIARTILKVAGAALATHGATKAAAIVNGEDVTGLVLTIVGILWSHWEHAPDAPATTTSRTSIYAWLLMGALAFGGTGFITGCSSTPQRVTYQAAATTTVTVETAIRAYNVLAAANKTTVEQNLQVKAAYEKYQAAMALVCDAGEIYSAAGGTNAPAGSLALQTAVANANATIADIVRLVQSFGVKL